MRDAYVQLINGRWWICTTSPAGVIVRLSIAYATQAQAEHATQILGFNLIRAPAEAANDG